MLAIMIIKLLSVLSILVCLLVLCLFMARLFALILSFSLFSFFFLSQDLYEKLQCNVDTAFLMTKQNLIYLSMGRGRQCSGAYPKY